MTTKRWTKKELNTLTRMRADGAPYKAIAEKLGRSTASVQQKAHKLKLKLTPKPEPTPEVQLELPLVEYRAEDMDINKLAEVLTKKPKTVDVDDLDSLEWAEAHEVDKLARAVDLYVPLAGGVMAGVLIGASLAMWML